MEPYLDNPSRKPEILLPISESELATVRRDTDGHNTLRRKKARRAWRFLHGLTLIGLVVYLASRYVSFHSFRKHGTGCHEQNALVQAEAIQRIDDWDYDVPDQKHIVRCASSDEWKPSDLAQEPGDTFDPVEVSFDLPLDSANLFLLSRGQYLGGKVLVETSDEQADDKATVKVKIYYRSEEALDWTKVCLLESAQNENENGVGIFTPIWGNSRWPDVRKRSLAYAVTVTLPTAAPGADLLRIKSFETDLPNTSQFLGSLEEDVVFNSIKLGGTNGIVRVDSLTTLGGFILTTNGKITGQINATDFLALTTTNSPIDVNVDFTDSNQANATLAIHTTNSPLKASINLVSAQGTEGSFYVSAKTTNGPLAVGFPTSPVDSILRLGAYTTNSPANVALDAAYEGTFSLYTSRFFRPSLRINNDVEDPAGKDRKRLTHGGGGRGVLTGSTQWGSEAQPEPKGSVFVSTTNAPISLSL